MCVLNPRLPQTAAGRGARQRARHIGNVIFRRAARGEIATRSDFERAVRFKRLVATARVARCCGVRPEYGVSNEHLLLDGARQPGHELSLFLKVCRLRRV